MATTTTSFNTTEVEIGQFDEYLDHIGCDTSGRKAFTIILCLCIGALMAVLMYFLYQLIQSKPSSLYKATISYFMLSFIYYISIILFILNQCYFHNIDLHNTAYIMITIGYTVGFELFIGMLFWRLYFVFKSTAYKVSKPTLYAFITFQCIGICPLTLFMFPAFFSFGRIGGIFMILIGIPWVSGLYIRRLYSVVKATENANSLEIDVNDRLLAQIAKHTILTILSVLGTVCILILAFVALIPSTDDWFWTNRMSYVCVVIDFATNIFAFILGYTYSVGMYNKLCRKLEKRCSRQVAQLVASSVGKKLKIRTNTLAKTAHKSPHVVEATATLSTQPRSQPVLVTQVTPAPSVVSQLSVGRVVSLPSEVTMEMSPSTASESSI
eukprot:23578_1